MKDLEPTDPLACSFYCGSGSGSTSFRNLFGHSQNDNGVDHDSILDILEQAMAIVEGIDSATSDSTDQHNSREMSRETEGEFNGKSAKPKE